MKKLLGTVNVYVDEEETKLPSHCKATSSGGVGHWPDVFEVTICPNTEKTFSARGLDNLTEKEKLQTLIAHELGHFVGLITHDKKQHVLYQALEGQLPAEKQAWELANRMDGVYVDPTMRRRCLETYVVGDARDWADPEVVLLRARAKQLLQKRIAEGVVPPWGKEND